MPAPLSCQWVCISFLKEEAREEALFVLDALDGRELDYPVVYDFESVSDVNGRANTLNSLLRTNNALVFCELIAEAGYTPMIYGNTRDLMRYHHATLASYAFWFAEYDASFPSGQFDFTIWQYTSS